MYPPGECEIEPPTASGREEVLLFNSYAYAITLSYDIFMNIPKLTTKHTTVGKYTMRAALKFCRT
jgi:hypothetical protein